MTFNSGVLHIHGGSIALYNDQGKAYVLYVGENGLFKLPECEYMGTILSGEVFPSMGKWSTCFLTNEQKRKGGLRMDAGKAVQALERSVLDAVNTSGLHR